MYCNMPKKGAANRESPECRPKGSVNQEGPEYKTQRMHNHINIKIHRER